jgi:hypothetical protein
MNMNRDMDVDTDMNTNLGMYVDFDISMHMDTDTDMDRDTPTDMDTGREYGNSDSRKSDMYVVVFSSKYSQKKKEDAMCYYSASGFLAQSESLRQVS